MDSEDDFAVSLLKRWTFTFRSTVSNAPNNVHHASTPPSTSINGIPFNESRTSHSFNGLLLLDDLDDTMHSPLELILMPMPRGPGGRYIVRGGCGDFVDDDDAILFCC